MAPSPPAASLTPQFCLSQTALRDFLRISRGATDDTIHQNLNALVSPSSTPFDPASTSQRTGLNSSSHRIPSTACESFQQTILFPAWESRSKVLTYCSTVASLPDPDDPEKALREQEEEKDRHRVVDERTDPYSARFFPRTSRSERLSVLIRQEQGVEDIIRRRTWKIFQDRCADTQKNLEDTLEQWRCKT